MQTVVVNVLVGFRDSLPAAQALPGGTAIRSVRVLCAGARRGALQTRSEVAKGLQVLASSQAVKKQAQQDKQEEDAQAPQPCRSEQQSEKVCERQELNFIFRNGMRGGEPRKSAHLLSFLCTTKVHCCLPPWLNFPRSPEPAAPVASSCPLLEKMFFLLFTVSLHVLSQNARIASVTVVLLQNVDTALCTVGLSLTGGRFAPLGSRTSDFGLDIRVEYVLKRQTGLTQPICVQKISKRPNKQEKKITKPLRERMKSRLEGNTKKHPCSVRTHVINRPSVLGGFRG